MRIDYLMHRYWARCSRPKIQSYAPSAGLRKARLR
jgi:hypothetical protein